MRLMIFVDGENVVFRYQEMKKKGRIPKEENMVNGMLNKHISHESDVYLWSPCIKVPYNCELIRAYYYTSATGDENKINSINEKIKNINPAFNHGNLTASSTLNLYPEVFKKTRKNQKSKGVDIKMAVDILSHTHQNNIDLVYLISGDGDYKPVVEEVIRQGKRIWIAAFSNGLNSALKLSADRFIDLDDIFFEPSQ